MRASELCRLVWLNLVQNKSKVILTAFGIVVGAATIMLVIAIGEGGRMEVAEQFQNLNAGAIDITYKAVNKQEEMMQRPVGMLGTSFAGGPGGMRENDNREEEDSISLTAEDMEDLEAFIPGLLSVTISYTTQADVEGGDLSENMSATVAGVKDNYAKISNMEMQIGDFLSEENIENKDKVCVLGDSIAKSIFGTAYNAYNASVYLDGRAYVISGVLAEMGSVTSGISPDNAVFIPYETGIKYLTGKNVNPTITVIAAEVSKVETVMENIKTVLADSYPTTEFVISDAGSKMEAAEKSNDTLTMLLVAMAVIVFIVGGIGIMNVLFVSVQERTNEIGVLKAIGCSRRDILIEFLLEAGCMSLVGAILGILAALILTPLIEQFSVRVELSFSGAVLSLVFGVLTGSVFGFYPAYKASRLIPVVALNQE